MTAPRAWFVFANVCLQSQRLQRVGGEQWSDQTDQPPPTGVAARATAHHVAIPVLHLIKMSWKFGWVTPQADAGGRRRRPHLNSHTFLKWSIARIKNTTVKSGGRLPGEICGGLRELDHCSPPWENIVGRRDFETFPPTQLYIVCAS